MSEGWLTQMQWPLSHDTARQLAPTAKIYPSARITRSVERLEMAEDAFIGDFCFVSVPDLTLGRGSQINSGTRIVGQFPVVIAENTVIGYGCTILTSSDQTDSKYMNDASPPENRRVRRGPVLLGERVFLGSHSIVMPDLGIAHGIAVRAFSYVNRSLLTKDAIYGGQPATLVGHRTYR